VAIGERRLIDGGVVNNTPISHAVELGATRIYILPTADPFVRDNLAAPRGALDAALRALSLAVGSRCAADLELYRDEAELILLPASNPWRVQPAEFDHAERLTRAALHGARSVLADASIPLERAA
jgi:NTE family protein